MWSSLLYEAYEVDFLLMRLAVYPASPVGGRVVNLRDCFYALYLLVFSQ